MFSPQENEDSTADTSTNFTAITPPESVDTDDYGKFSIPTPLFSSVPWPGSTFIIRSVGWLGFRNPVSGKFLGHDKKGRLCCIAQRIQGWERFCVRIRPEGGYLLLMTEWDSMWPVGIKEEDVLAKSLNSWGFVWQFVSV
ncbi:MAG: hypothetical protein M1829_001647 [Trizodia sp. TS-e1964]|nr:MAG: hypothetical protein M1829_001647 [Trizodia sp. TS-e1964]